MKENIKKNIVCSIGALLLPFIILSLYLYLSRLTGVDTEWSDYLFMGIAVISGVICVFCLRINLIVRILLIPIYSLCFGYLLFFYAFIFIGEVFGNWL